MATRALGRRRSSRAGRVRAPWCGRALFASLALAPITIALHYLADLPETAEFVLAALALDPARVAHRRGDRARRRAHGPGNRRLPERDVRERARAHHRAHRRERGADRGRARLAHGKRRRRTSCSSSAPRSSPAGAGTLDRYSSFLSFGLIAFATLLFLIPSVPGWDGDPDTRRRSRWSRPRSRSCCSSSTSPSPGTRCGGTARCTSRPTTRSRAGRCGPRSACSRVATVVTALVAEILVGSLEVFSEKVGLSEFFVAAVIVAIVGNAAEHGGAVVVAHPRQDRARRRDRARVGRAGRGLPHPRGRAALVAHRPALAELPAGRDRRARRLGRPSPRSCSSAGSRAALAGRSCSPATAVVVVAFFLAGDR